MDENITIKGQVAKLIDCRTLMTLSLTLLVFILSLQKVITGEQVVVIYTSIVSFFFGTKFQQNATQMESKTAQTTQAIDTKTSQLSANAGGVILADVNNETPEIEKHA